MLVGGLAQRHASDALHHHDPFHQRALPRQPDIQRLQQLLIGSVVDQRVRKKQLTGMGGVQQPALLQRMQRAPELRAQAQVAIDETHHAIGKGGILPLGDFCGEGIAVQTQAAAPRLDDGAGVVGGQAFTVGQTLALNERLRLRLVAGVRQFPRYGAQIADVLGAHLQFQLARHDGVLGWQQGNAVAPDLVRRDLERANLRRLVQELRSLVIQPRTDQQQRIVGHRKRGRIARQNLLPQQRLFLMVLIACHAHLDGTDRFERRVFPVQRGDFAVNIRHQGNQRLLPGDAGVDRKIVGGGSHAQIGTDEARVQRHGFLVEGDGQLPVRGVELCVVEFALHEAVVGHGVVGAPVLHAGALLGVQMNLQRTDDIRDYGVLYREQVPLGHVEAA